MRLRDVDDDQPGPGAHRDGVHRRTGPRRTRGLRHLLRGLPWHGPAGTAAAGGRGLRQRVGLALHARLADRRAVDAARVARRPDRGHLPGRHGVHPASQRRNARRAGTDDGNNNPAQRDPPCRGRPGGGRRRDSSRWPWRRARGGSASGCRPRTRTTRGPGDGADRSRDGAQLPARHRRHAAQPAGQRLADAAARPGRIKLQPTESDHTRQRARAAAGLGRADGRGRHQSAVARWRAAARCS